MGDLVKRTQATKAIVANLGDLAKVPAGAFQRGYYSSAQLLFMANYIISFKGV